MSAFFVDDRQVAYYNLGMIKRIVDYRPRWVVTFILVILTTILIDVIAAHIIAYSFLRPKAISDTYRPWSGYFTVVAMAGKTPVQLTCQWPDENEHIQNGSVTQSVVYAKTGKADKPFRYYLTNADLEQANSQLDSTAYENRNDVEVTVLDNNQQSKFQTLKVTVSGEEEDRISVYKVENDHIHPVGWTMFRYRIVGFGIIFINPFVLAISGLFWSYFLKRKYPVGSR